MLAFAITKETMFQGQLERFDNVYYYDTDVQFGDANIVRAMDELVAAEKAIHTSLVTWVMGRCWSAGGTPAENETLLLKDYTGSGTMQNLQPIHAEAAVLVQWETDRVSEVGRKVYLRKYIRPQGLNLGDTQVGAGKAALSAAAKAPYEAYADRVGLMNPSGFSASWNLCSPSGRVIKATGNGFAHDYVGMHEFRRN